MANTQAQSKADSATGWWLVAIAAALFMVGGTLDAQRVQKVVDQDGGVHYMVKPGDPIS